MSDDLAKSIAEKKARLAEQAAAIERDLAELAELERLAAKHNLVVSAVPPAATIDPLWAASETAMRQPPHPGHPWQPESGLYHRPAPCPPRLASPVLPPEVRK